MLATLYHVYATLLVVGLIFYCLPSIIAFSRQPPNSGSIYVVNLLLGWTIWGWVTSLAMAVRTIPRAARPVVRRSVMGVECVPARPASTLEQFLDRRSDVDVSE